MKKLLLLIVLAMMFQHLLAQPKIKTPLKTYITFEAGPQWSFLKASDPNGVFKNAAVRSSVAGFTLGQEIIPNLSIVTGAYYTPNRNGINMDDKRPHQAMWSSYNSLLVPLRVEYRIQPTEYPFSFTPRLGYVFGLVQAGDAYTASSTLSSADGMAYSYRLNETYTTDNLHMVEIGIGLNLRIHGFWQASFNISYMAGLSDPLSTGLEYTSDGSTYTMAGYASKGSSLQTTLALNVPFSNIWQNSDYRKRKRIEKSVYEGKPTDRKGEFYLGAEVGSLWRIFNATNPAIGARPMEERGIFKYANLHAGGYLGYMINNELGIDAGAYYQGSSTFYAIMYDHRVNFAAESTAPLYIELPLRVRYFYKIPKTRMYAAVYGGASLLTSISSGSIATGGGDFTYNAPQSASPINATTTYEASRTAQIRPLLRMGAGMEYRLPTKIPLIATLYANYMHGFSSTDQIDVTNFLVGETPATSTINYNGSGWSLDIGLKFPFRFGGEGICEDLPTRE